MAATNSNESSQIIYGVGRTTGTILEVASSVNERLDVCGEKNMPSVAIEVENYREFLAELKARGIKIRYLTEITEDNLSYCKELMDLVSELRHLEAIKGIFYVTEGQYLASTAIQQAQPVEQVIHSNVKEVVQMQQFVFDTLWNRAIAAELKINEMEEQKVGQFVTARTEIIQNPQIVQELFIDMIKSAEKEILLIIPTINAFLREERLGIIKLLKNVAIQRDINIKILSPINDFVDKIMQSIEEVQGKRANYFDLRPVEQTYEEMTVTTVTIIIVDKKASLVIEKLDDSEENFIDATGSSTYSNSKPTVSSYIAIFESLWARAKLYEQLKKHNKMQQEFINVAAHELRTPTQSILGYAELLKANIQDTEPTNQAFVDIIYRNATRLHGLTTDILDVTRIESQTLKLNKRRFNLKDVIINAIDDIQGNPVVNRNNVKIFYKPINGKDETIFVDADMDRITQVITNLLDNALKFTSAQGYVSVTLERKDKQEGLGEEVVVVDVEDTGSGIEPEIFPRLFTKFVSKSFEGTGLGLYISKSLIEAHGGRISAKNNDRKKCGGATFSFTLPLVK